MAKLKITRANGEVTEHKKKATIVAPPEGVSDSVWQEFKSLRKAKKAPITQRAIDKISEEANLAGWTLEKALEECIVRCHLALVKPRRQLLKHDPVNGYAM